MNRLGWALLAMLFFAGLLYKAAESDARRRQLMSERLMVAVYKAAVIRLAAALEDCQDHRQPTGGQCVCMTKTVR